MKEIKDIRKDYNEELSELKQQNEILKKKDAMSLGTMELKKNVWNN